MLDNILVDSLRTIVIDHISYKQINIYFSYSICVIAGSWASQTPIKARTGRGSKSSTDG
jgi:hypothetical protein